MRAPGWGDGGWFIAVPAMSPGATRGGLDAVIGRLEHPAEIETVRSAVTPARPETFCPCCGRPSADVLCDTCEAREVTLYLANNSLTDDRGVQRGDDPRR